MKKIHPIWLISLILVFIKVGLLRYAQNNTSQIEMIYSRGIYPTIAGFLTRLSNQFPFSIGELSLGLILMMVLVIVCWSIFLMIKRQWKAMLYMLSCMFLSFMLIINYLDISWLLNNYRTDLKTILGQTNDEISVKDLEETYFQLIVRTNALRSTLKEDADGYPNELSIEQILNTTYKGYSDLKKQYSFIEDDKVVVKGLVTSPLQTMSGYTGIYLFFIGEPTINIKPPIFTLPHTAAHEIAHQKGFAQEDDANYIGFLACKYHPSEFVKYSGYLAALEYTAGAMYQADPEKYKILSALYDEKVKQDLLFVNSFWEEARNDSASEVVNQLNETYLKSYNQPEGLQSYDKFVELLVGDYLADDEV